MCDPACELKSSVGAMVKCKQMKTKYGLIFHLIKKSIQLKVTYANFHKLKMCRFQEKQERYPPAHYL